MMRNEATQVGIARGPSKVVPEIEDQILLLGKGQEELSARLCGLHERLSPVLNSVPKGESPGLATAMPPLCPLGEQIRQAYYRNNDMLIRVESILAALQL